MSETAVQIVKRWKKHGHQRILRAVEDLTNDQISYRPTPNAHSIAFKLWHVARAADWFAQTIAAMTPALESKLGGGLQIWQRDGLAAKWGLDAAVLGMGEMGGGMDDQTAATLQLPSKDVLVGYARSAFAAADHAVDAIDEQEFLMLYDATVPFKGKRPIGDFVMLHLGHDEWNLGAISALRRAQGLGHVEG